MTPAARVQAAIEVLDAILSGMPAERALTGWARGSRYAGSGDRAAVRDHVFQALRCKRSYAAIGGAETGRGLMLGALRADAVTEGLPGSATISEIFTGTRFAPEPLSEVEMIPGIATEDDLLDLPDWLIAAFRNALGADAAKAASLLRQRAPVMVRVNLGKTDVPEAIATLAAEGIAATPAPIAGTALILGDGARRLAQSNAYRAGLVELQDGSSQAAMDLVCLPASGKVLDYCAGGGGKTLALAARDRAGLTWYAHDAHPARMKDLPARAARAGVQVSLVNGDPQSSGPFDLVLCDVPCSGSGTWRRSPDAKWTLTPAQLDDLLQMQARILAEATPMVAQGGCLAYATCSVLREENEEQIETFLDSHPKWSCVLQMRWPLSDMGDGFFVSVLNCKNA